MMFFDFRFLDFRKRILHYPLRCGSSTSFWKHIAKRGRIGFAIAHFEDSPAL